MPYTSYTSSDAAQLTALLGSRSPAVETLCEREWARLVELALLQGVGPVFYARLKDRGLLPPPSVDSQLRTNYLASAARNLRLFHELAQILEAFQASGIAVIPLKGACLAEVVYGNIALRPMADIDLLVRSGQVATALVVLRALGYESQKPFDAVAAQTFSHDMPLMSKAGCVPIELHWTIANPSHPGGFRASDLEGLWSRAQPATISGVSVLMLSPTDLMLHLCRHASVEHRFAGVGLRSFLDIERVARVYAHAIDWDAFASRATEWQIARGVHLTLQLAGEWTEFECPPGVLAKLDAEPLDDASMAWVRQKILGGSSADVDSPAVRFAGTAGFGGHLAALRVAVTPSRDAIASVYRAPLKSWPILKYYFDRPRRLWHDHGPVLWRILRGDKAFVADARKEARLREYLGWR